MNGINRIKLAQFNTKTIRLVIEDSEKVGIKFTKEGKKLLITIKPKNTSSGGTQVVQKDYTPKRMDRNKVIVIDPGHGGKDPGAIGYKKYREKIVVYKISKHLRNILKKRGYKVYMTRYSDKFIKLKNRTAYANKKKADLFVSIHANAVGKKHAKKVHGIECYFLSPSKSKKAERIAATENSADLSDMNSYGKKSFLNFLNHRKIVASNKLAIDLQRGMLGALSKKYKNVKDGGVREGPFWVLVGAQMPAVLVEVGFISHPTEAKRLVDDNYRKTMAKGLADGIERYFANN
jgi:N-acetylmuramoyl-L-alanine amidase